jgi:hypothetical protein
MDIIAIKKDEHLMQMATRIFGDIIDGAYICSDSDYRSYKENDLKKELENRRFVYIEDEIDIGDSVIIEFVNGHAVYFSSSEWGTIQEINIDSETKEFF